MSIVTAPATPMTVEQFWAWAESPENADGMWELEDGIPVNDWEPDVPTRPHGIICTLVVRLFANYVFARGAGHVTSNDTTLIISRDPARVRGPDIMVFTESATLGPESDGPVDTVPALIVEVYSPTDRPGQLKRRVGDFFTLGVPVVWVVYPDEQSVHIYTSTAAPVTAAGADELTVASLQGFRCTAADLFALPGAKPVS